MCNFVDSLKTLFHYLIPKHTFTTLAGKIASNNNPRIKNFIILRFIKQFHVNMSEALIENPREYASFNDFFIRHLKPECRPLAQADIISPVDGSVSEIGGIDKGQLLQAKGKYYTVKELLACNDEVANQYENGKFVTLYLSPKDYHRVHMPIDAELQSMTYIPGALFSVQPLTTRTIPKLFARNERVVAYFNTKIGPMVMVMVGATIVGSIGVSWHGELKRTKEITHFNYDKKLLLSQGDEMGYFKLGSTVVLLFANGERLQWEPHFKTGSNTTFGEALGSLKKDE